MYLYIYFMYTGELSVHRDGALMTFSLLLNDPSDFVGGGTYFEESNTNHFIYYINHSSVCMCVGRRHLL